MQPDPVANTQMLEVGALVGDYRIEGLVGQGGMGQVYGAIHPLIGKRAAIKVLRRELCADAETIERFVLEARAVNQIGHPNIVDVFAFGALPDGRQYMVMEWLRGESLNDRIERQLPTIDEACEILLGICAALDAAHAEHIVHRDLKPHNVFLQQARGRRPEVKLLDFGLVKLMGNDDVRIERTRSGSLLGTPAYMSPEQARGRGVDHRTDLYALGVMMFQLVTGQLPFMEPSAMEIVVAHLQYPPPVPSAVRPGLPPQLDALILGLLAKEPAQRPTLADVMSVLGELRRVAATTPPTGVPAIAYDQTIASQPHMPAMRAMTSVPAGQMAVTSAVQPPPNRSRRIVLAAFAAIALGAITFVAVARSTRSEETNRPEAAGEPPPTPTAPLVTIDAAVAMPPPSVDAAVAAAVEPDAAIAVVTPDASPTKSGTKKTRPKPDAGTRPPPAVTPDAAPKPKFDDDDGLLPSGGRR